MSSKKKKSKDDLVVVITRETAMQSRLESFLESQRRRYEVAPELTLCGSNVKGFLVTFSQRHQYEEVLGVDVKMGVLEDAGNGATTLEWGRVSSETPIFSSPFGRPLSSQILPGDRPFRRLQFTETKGCYLIQTACRTLAWMAADAFVSVPQSEAEALFYGVRRALRGQPLAITTRSLIELDRAARILASNSVPYQLGGRSVKHGIDCSALSQQLFDQHLDILLPRHSGDQRRCGLRVARSDLAPGDLIYATAQHRRWPHIAIVLSEGQLVHACRSRGQIYQESLDQFLDHYQFRSARRIGEVP
jgi:hypothetical protein